MFRIKRLNIVPVFYCALFINPLMDMYGDYVLALAH